jgi:hypothetical protein
MMKLEKKMSSRAFHKGGTAFKDGKEISDHPYGTKLFDKTKLKFWLLGWNHENSASQGT